MPVTCHIPDQVWPQDLVEPFTRGLMGLGNVVVERDTRSPSPPFNTYISSYTSTKQLTLILCAGIRKLLPLRKLVIS